MCQVTRAIKLGKDSKKIIVYFTLQAFYQMIQVVVLKWLAEVKPIFRFLKLLIEKL